MITLYFLYAAGCVGQFVIGAYLRARASHYKSDSDLADIISIICILWPLTVVCVCITYTGWFIAMGIIHCVRSVASLRLIQKPSILISKGYFSLVNFLTITEKSLPELVESKTNYRAFEYKEFK